MTTQLVSTVKKLEKVRVIDGNGKMTEGEMMVAYLQALGCRLKMQIGDTVALTTGGGQLIDVNMNTARFSRTYNGRIIAKGTGLYALRGL